jgi:hypothetical protein
MCNVWKRCKVREHQDRKKEKEHRLEDNNPASATIVEQINGSYYTLTQQTVYRYSKNSWIYIWKQLCRSIIEQVSIFDSNLTLLRPLNVNYYIYNKHA